MRLSIMLLDNVYAPDNRVENEINTLVENGFSVDLYCVVSEKLEKLEKRDGFTINREIPPIFYRPFSKEYRIFVKEFAKKIASKTPEIIHCHDFRMLFLGVEIKKLSPTTKLIYDSHEYLVGYPYFIRNASLTSMIKGFFIWTYYIFGEKKSFKYTDAIITVSENLRGRLGKSSKKPSYLIRNIPPNFTTCVENCNFWHNHFQLKEGTKVLIHTGNAHYSFKRTMWLLKAVAKHKGLALVFLGSNKSLNKIENLAKKETIDNVYFHEQIPRKYMTYYCSQADFGLVYTWNRYWKSYWFALPNKLIDVSLGGLPVLATNQPELKTFIDEMGNGITFNGNSEIALNDALSKIIKEENVFLKNARLVHTKINWEKESKVLLDVYNTLLVS